MKERQVVITVFPGVQSLDAVGPTKVFAGATRAAQMLGRPGGYHVVLASTDGQPISIGEQRRVVRGTVATHQREDRHRFASWR